MLRSIPIVAALMRLTLVATGAVVGHLASPVVAQQVALEYVTSVRMLLS